MPKGPGGRLISLPRAYPTNPPDRCVEDIGQGQNSERTRRIDTMKITKQHLPDIAAAFASSGKVDRIFFDDDLPGFGIRFRQGAKRQVYVVQYERQGVQRRLTLGTTAILDPDEARKLARRELAKVTLGHDPQGDKAAAKAKAKVTLLAVAQQFLDVKQKKLRNSSLREIQRHLLKDWKPLHAFPIHK